MVVVSAVLLAAFTRLIPHPPNFAPMTAMALFAGATLLDRRLALLTPLLALFFSDMCIEAAHQLGLMPTWGLYDGWWFNYAAILLITGLGILLHKRRTVLPIAAATLTGSVIFFIVSNFGVWALGNWYPPTFSGLIECYIAGIPFFHNSLLGDLAYGTVLFGGFALAEKYWPVLRELPASPITQGVEA
jgi:hypothetical protein